MKRTLLFIALILTPYAAQADTLTSGSVQLIKISTGIADKTGKSYGEKLTDNFNVIAATITNIISTANANNSALSTRIDTVGLATGTLSIRIDNLDTSTGNITSDVSNRFLAVANSTNTIGLTQSNTNYIYNSTSPRQNASFNVTSGTVGGFTANSITSTWVSASTIGLTKMQFADGTSMITAAVAAAGGTTTIKPQLLVPYDIQLASQGFGGNGLLFYTGYSTWTLNSAFFALKKSTVGATVMRVKVTTGTNASDFGAYGVAIANPVVVTTNTETSPIFWFSSATIPAHQWIGVDVEQTPTSGDPPRNLIFNPTMTPQ